MKDNWRDVLKRESDCKYVIPKSYRQDMRVPGVIIISEKLMPAMYEDDATMQVVNVATLPGILKYSLAMPDIHYGYGFPIGGVAATSLTEGVISPGGVGFDINCGVRLLRTNMNREDITQRSDKICNTMFSVVPCGVGSKGDIRVGETNLKKVLEEGARYAVRSGFGWEDDPEFCEEEGAMAGADASAVSRRAIERGLPQLGTLGSGNHFLEVQYVEEIYDEEAARKIGLAKDQVTVMIHSGSRGLGHQVCQDFINIMKTASDRYNIHLVDRQLACAPIDSPEGKKYFAAMAAAANYAWANRQYLAHLTREAFMRVFRVDSHQLGMSQIYDVAHNIAKMEEHDIDGKRQRVCVHRKGATRAFPAHHPQIPKKYSAIGQPVLVPGDMGRASYVLRGTERAMTETFGSICHGAGRLKSRTAAKADFTHEAVLKDLESKGICLKAADRRAILEEAPQAYKDVSLVVESCVCAGIATKVLKLRPMIVIKG
ncbi:MAG: RtcB family protein [bacterium]